MYLAEKLSEIVTSKGATLMLSTIATSIHNTTDGVTVLLEDGKELNGNIVVVALPPRLAVSRLTYNPPLSQHHSSSLRSITTWMGSTTKVVLVFSTPFWRAVEWPDVYHYDDAIGQWNDASSELPAPGVYAILGFGRSGITQQQVMAQIARLFGDHVLQYLISYHSVDWSVEKWTSSSVRDGHGYHPSASDVLRSGFWDNKMYFSSTEMSDREAGYMDGAVRRGKQVASKILKSIN
ncbi:hypothetical protein AKO1_001306, partial [Acrasis kona]